MTFGSSNALADFFGTSKEEFFEDVPVDDQPVVDEQPVDVNADTVPAPPRVQPENAELIARLDRMESAAANKDAEEKARLDKILSDLISGDDPEPELPDLATISARAAKAEELVLELATKQTLAEVTAAVGKYGVDRQELVDAVIASEGGDPDMLAAQIVAKDTAQEKAYLDRRAAKNPAVAAALASQAQAAAKKGQDAPTLKGAPTGAVQPDPTSMKRKPGETSAEHLERLMEAGASLF